MSGRDRAMVLMGQETTRGRLYGGLYLLLGGFVLGVIALVFFFVSGNQTAGSGAYFGWREASLVLGAVAVTTFFVGISTALPSRRGMRVASYVGMGLCALAILLLTIHYPAQFNVQDSPDPAQAAQDRTALDTIVFAAGLALIVAGAFVSVVAYWVESMGRPRTDEDDEWTGRGYEVPDWVVEKDMADAERRHGVSWGLGEKQDAVQIDVPDIGEDAVIGGKGKVKTVRLSANRVDQAMATLQRTRPDFARNKSLPGDWTDDAVAKLRAFQQQKEDAPSEFTPKLGFWARLFRRRSRLTPVEQALAEAQEGVEVGGGMGGAKTIVIKDDEG